MGSVRSGARFTSEKMHVKFDPTNLDAIDADMKMSWLNSKATRAKDERRRVTEYMATFKAAPSWPLRPCMKPGCWIECFEDKCFCTAHELLFVAEYERPSPQCDSDHHYELKLKAFKQWAARLCRE